MQAVADSEECVTAAHFTEQVLSSATVYHTQSLGPGLKLGLFPENMIINLSLIQVLDHKTSSTTIKCLVELAS